MRALTRCPVKPAAPLTELARIESDPAYRALFFAGLDAAVADRFATRSAVVDEIEAAADRLRSLIRNPDADERAA